MLTVLAHNGKFLKKKRKNIVIVIFLSTVEVTTRDALDPHSLFSHSKLQHFTAYK